MQDTGIQGKVVDAVDSQETIELSGSDLVVEESVHQSDPGTAANHASTLVILPTYNEIDNIEVIVQALVSLDPRLHLLIIDDSSPDGTGELAENLRSVHPKRMTVIHRPEKLGLGTAYILGFRHALANGYSRIVEMDSDLSHLPEQLPSILQASDGHGMALGSRYVKGGCTVRWGIHRRLLSYWANLFVRMVLGIAVRDATSGYRCYSRTFLETVDLDSIHSKSYAFQIEMVWLCLRAGFGVREVPISFVERERGVSKISKTEIFEGLGTVFRLRHIACNNHCSAHVIPLPAKSESAGFPGDALVTDEAASQAFEPLQDAQRS